MHFPSYLQGMLANLRECMKDSFGTDLRTTLHKMLWPKRTMLEEQLPKPVQDSLEQAVSQLLILQRPDLEHLQDDEPQDGQLTEPRVLFPLEMMVEPIEQRFQYHFTGDRPTNRLDKPEYFMSHFLDVVAHYSGFMDSAIQPCLWEAFRESRVAETTAYFDAPTAWIVSLLPMMRKKLLYLMPQVSSRPQLFSHLIHELVKLDMTLREECQFNLTDDAASPWRGFTWMVLVKDYWFDHWLAVEKDFALARYEAIVDDPGASVLDYTHNEHDRVMGIKPTKAAVRLKDLLCAIVSTYKPLPSFSQKLRFLIDIHINLLDRFHERLRSGIEAFISMTSSIGRTVKGVSAADSADLQGLAGLERLCRIYGAVDYLRSAMDDWSDDVFFVDLWTELQNRAKSSDERGGRVAGPLNLAEVATQTSAALAVANADDNDDPASRATRDESSALFDEIAGAYAVLRARAETEMSNFLAQTMKESLRPYTRLNAWNMNPLASTGSDEISTISSEMTAPLQIFSDSLSFLAKNLSPAALRHMTKAACRMIDSMVFDRAILSHTVNQYGARQLAVDVASLSAVADKYLGSSGVSAMKRIKAAIELLNVRSEGMSHKCAREERNEWGVVDGEEMIDSRPIDLWTVNRRLFASNASARDLLEELGMIGALSEQEAMSVLRCRTELAT